MHRPKKRPKTPKDDGNTAFGAPMPKGDPDGKKASMTFRLHGPPSHRKRKPTR
jgi:hypothetical protein